jgi:guanylate kinase
MTVLYLFMENLIVVIEGPSGVGKDSIIKGLISNHPKIYSKLPSVTNREMRPDESQGNPYFFVSEKDFVNMLNCGDIFEHTVRHGTYRGMSYEYINNILKQNKIPLKDCDIVGVRALKKAYPNRVLTIWITADKEQVRSRMLNRGDLEADMKARLNDYDEKQKESIYYDYTVENNILEETIENVNKIIQSHYKELL